MRNLVMIVTVTLILACSYDSNLPLDKGNPEPTSKDAVTVPEDSNPWTFEKCQLDEHCSQMEGLAACQTGKCVNGECVITNVVPGTECTSSDIKGECRRGVCELVGGELKCVDRPAIDGSPCGDFYPACGTTGKCKNGVCIDPCDDGNVCTDDKCLETGCVHTFNNAPCDDNVACTVNDTCIEGECIGERVCECKTDIDCLPFDDGDLCNGTMWCKKASDGYNTCEINKSKIVKCPTTGFEPCQAYVCQPKTGQCKFQIAPDGTPCDDGNKCTQSDFCVQGECKGFKEISCEFECADGVDEDQDSVQDCEDPDCYGVGDCPTPECGDGQCQELADENCDNCPEDCGECPPECGDNILQVENGEECDDGNLESGDLCSALCKVEPAPALPGDVIVSEIMKNPLKVEDLYGEWIELYNTTDQDIDINAWTIKDLGADKHRIFKLGGLVIPAKGYLTLGRNEDKATNGGVSLDYQYTGFTLGNTQDQIIIMSGDILIDQVAYDDGLEFPNLEGASLSLSPDKMTATENDVGANWCAGQDPFGAGDLGSPGTANPPCPFCGDGKCNAGEDCASCAEDCSCGEKAICVNGTCVDLKTDGSACSLGEECLSGFCVDGVCCETPCDGVCQSCNQSANVGKCTFYPAGEDPENECPATDETTCGFTGFCDGAGACAFWPDTTVCAPQKCIDSTLYFAAKCTGSGKCPQQDSESCCPYKCDTLTPNCLGSCVDSTQCCPGNYCDNNACVSKKDPGMACKEDEECLSNLCIANKCQ